MINLELDHTLINNFNRDGFIILEKFIEIDFIKNLKERFEPLFRGKFERLIKILLVIDCQLKVYYHP